MLLRSHAVFHNVWDQVPIKVREVDSNGDDAAHSDTREDDRGLADVETVDSRVDKREGFEEAVVDTVGQGRVEIDEQDGGVLDGDFDWLNDGVDDRCLEGDAFPVDLSLRTDAFVASDFAEASGAVEQDRRGLGFGQAEEHEQEDRAGHPEDLPL